MDKDDQKPVAVKYPRNVDLDPQLVWRGKDLQDWSDLVVQAPPLYIQEKVRAKTLVDDLLRYQRELREGGAGAVDPSEDAQGQFMLDLFKQDFNGIPDGADKTEFYQHDSNWTNRMILGDSLQVMASLAEREGLRGKVQCIYLDPPYGIKFNSNFQWSTTSRDVKDGKADHITREPEQVKAFRDTWRDGIHSYLTYLRDRLTVARDLLTESGSIFVQIGDENVHRVRALMDEVFGEENFVSQITVQTTTGFEANYLGNMSDFVLWYKRLKTNGKANTPFYRKEFVLGDGNARWLFLNDFTYRGVSSREQRGEQAIPEGSKPYKPDNIISQGRSKEPQPFDFRGKIYDTWAKNSHWKANYPVGMSRLAKACRIHIAENSIQYIRFHNDFDVAVHGNIWTDTGSGSFTDDKMYVVQTNTKVIERCILMAPNPGDLVLDPTCGSGTTAYVAEQWGRRWITIDTSRVALALARARIMGARYPYYLLADSVEGQRKEAEVTRTAPSSRPVRGNLRQGFVYERVPHITLKSIANNAEIDVIWDKWQPEIRKRLSKLRDLTDILKENAAEPFAIHDPAAIKAYQQAVAALPSKYEEWTVPRECPLPMQDFELRAVEHYKRHMVERETPAFIASQRKAAELYAQRVEEARRGGKKLDLDEEFLCEPSGMMEGTPAIYYAIALLEFWDARIKRQKEIDASIAAKAEFEYLYDKPYEDKKKVRVAGPFTVESLSPHRMLGVDENDDLIDPAVVREADPEIAARQSFPQMILENLRAAGVQQAHKEDKITFTTLTLWPGEYVCAEGRYLEGDTPRRAAIFIGPEFGTVQRADLVSAAREAGDAGFDVLISCAFNYEAHTTDFNKLGRIPVLKARMNADLHMADDLKTTAKANLFVIFGEPDIELIADPDGRWRVKVRGVDIFRPQTGEVVSNGPEGIACWFVDTDYNEESFFVRHAYFLGASDPYKALRTTLKAEINEEAWATLNSDTSRPFRRPRSGRIAVKVINHLGDEVMKVFKI